ncbi:MAG: Methyltransferase type 11 [Rhodospirillales bacterium]|nr:Methyltransferase type 11 [Rhodospirillales bacterium]
MKLANAVRGGLRRWLSPPPSARLDTYEIRALVARDYIRGEGIEFGALHSALKVPNGVTVRYADFEPAEKLRNSFPDVANIQRPDLVSDLESMKGIETASQDFIIANHVLEHVEDPLRALHSVARVLRPSGIAVMALPDKRFTFDKDREVTRLDHLIRDNEEGPDASLLSHYEEWVRCVDDLHSDEAAGKIALMTQIRANIHFHVWDYPAMMELFAYVAKTPTYGLEVESSRLNGIEVIWILRRRNELT